MAGGARGRHWAAGVKRASAIRGSPGPVLGATGSSAVPATPALASHSWELTYGVIFFLNLPSSLGSFDVNINTNIIS